MLVINRASTNRRIPSYLFLQDKVMQRKIETGKAIDISFFPRTKTGEYILPEYLPRMEYCDTRTEQWVYSIGKEYGTGAIHAATNTRLYQNPRYSCLWVKNIASYQ